MKLELRLVDQLLNVRIREKNLFMNQEETVQVAESLQYNDEKQTDSD